MLNHNNHQRYLYLTFSPHARQEEFVQLVNNSLASYSSNDIYASSHAGVCISCIWDCLKDNNLTELLLPTWELTSNCIVSGSDASFGQFLDKGKKYRFRTRIFTEGTYSNWTLTFKEIIEHKYDE